MANPKAQGHETTNTEMLLCITKCRSISIYVSKNKLTQNQNTRVNIENKNMQGMKYFIN